ncbi:HNHc domain containing protein [uncultured Caudovirales phage]|uniref:HNHc domain containing protein n=1 Tax=uncultured Caudovirales phage TaxID=2100421 RepID=A0A6J5RHP6_9CAUD|nr:HNHc domain containing protein [uncultured Caudovirales phage]CAB4195592.1 HNHc domain containing protein [uncultured Caudovirales phage]CAB4204933.1 HNHc domain containing protein [uncultured Caudovirales phage]
MPYKDKSDRNYRREYDTYQGTEEQKKNRAERNAARAKLAKAGRVHKGDGKDVDHAKPLSKGGSNAPGNLRVKTAHANRSFKRNKDHSIK